MEGHRYADDPEPSWYSGQSQYARSTGPEVSGSHSLGASAASMSGSVYDSGIHERPSGAFRLPDQRAAAGHYPTTDPLTTTGSHARVGEPQTRNAYDSVRIPVRGPEYPAVRPTAEAPGAAPAAYGAEPTSLVPPVSGERLDQARLDQARLDQARLDQARLDQARLDQARLDQARLDQARPGESVYRSRRPVSSFVVATGMVVLMIPVLRLLFSAAFAGTPTAAAIVPAVLFTLGFALTGIGLFAVAGGRPLGREAWLRPPVAYLPAGLILLVAAGLAIA